MFRKYRFDDMTAEKKKKKNNQEFSKWLLIQESVLIWIITIAFLGLAFLCVVNQFFGELPWLAAMVAFPWGAYGVSQAFYYKKSMAENTKNGIKYDSVVNKTNDEADSEEGVG